MSSKPNLGDNVEHKNLSDWEREPEPKLYTAGIDEASGTVTEVNGDWCKVNNGADLWPCQDLIIKPDTK